MVRRQVSKSRTVDEEDEECLVDEDGDRTISVTSLEQLGQVKP